jgi:hypothetical protein
MSIPKLYDPWLEQDDRWAPHQLQPDDNLAMPDLTPTTLRRFLRELPPPQTQPKPMADDDFPRLGHIHGY